MKKPRQLRVGSLGTSWPIVACVAVACLVLTACEEGGGSTVFTPPAAIVDSEAFDMSGTWSMTVNPVDPPRVVLDCTEDLAGQSFAFCEEFEVTVTQDDVFFLPEQGSDPGGQFCGSFFVVTGTSMVQEITGVIGRTRIVSVVPPISELQDLEFQAGVIGDSGTFALVRLTLQDMQGECTLGGSYLGTRAASP